ncbi:MAG TPA: hypothetical protein DCZ03_11370, partial [Gammaproteobacteria bacterium]|nr:hypothetical protein [Gammaproteobacteria bacterium]
MQNLVPIVLCIGGLDPSGGAGITADLVTLRDLKCHGTAIMTANTLQDSYNCRAYFPTSAKLLKQQIQLLFDDFNIAVVKVGMLGSAEIVDALVDALPQPLNIPLVLDPIWQAGGGGSLTEPDVFPKIVQRLLPLCTLITPNIIELEQLLKALDQSRLPTTSLDPTPLFSTGVRAILVTGGETSGEHIEDNLYTLDHKLYCHRWPRKSGLFHGTGCTLSTAICAYLAHHKSLAEAVTLAEKYLHQRLDDYIQFGHGQFFMGSHK